MSGMRLGLIAIGVLFIIAVWLFNKFQERRIARGMEGRFANDSADVLFNGDDSERDPLGRSEPGAKSRNGERFEPSLGEAGDAPYFAHGPGLTEPSAPVEQTPIDPAIHAVMTLTVDQALPTERWLTAVHGLRHAGRQQVIFEGEDAMGPTPLRPGARYPVLRLGVQLASRSGPLNEIEFSEFVALLQQLGESMNATCEVPDMMETIAQARTLDARCAPLDASVGINLVCPDGNFATSNIIEAARACGLVARSDHRLVAYGPADETLFILQNADGGVLLGERAPSATARVTFILEVPRAARELEPFSQMKNAALSMAMQLEGLVVDDELRTLTDSALTSIGKQIEPVYEQLDALGLGAGSARALALFR